MKKIISLVLAVFCIMSVCLFSGCEGKKTTLDAVTINGKTIECRMDMEKVLSMFEGMEYDYSESISCAYNGLDKIYDFADAGFTVYTYPDGDKDYVLEVAVYGEGIKQLNDQIFVGMKKSELETLFGTDYKTEGDTVTYTVKDEQTMYYLFDGDSVIEYAISVAE